MFFMMILIQTYWSQRERVILKIINSINCKGDEKQIDINGTLIKNHALCMKKYIKNEGEEELTSFEKRMGLIAVTEIELYDAENRKNLGKYQNPDVSL